MSIDSKNRLSIPYTIRTKLRPEEDGQLFYVLPGRRKGTLAIYTDKYFEKLHEELPGHQKLSHEAYECQQFDFSQSALCEPDNQGRIVIPERLLKRSGIGGEAMLIGVRDHMELWDRKDYEAFEDGRWPSYSEQRQQTQEELDTLKEEERLKRLKELRIANELKAMWKDGGGSDESNGNVEKPESRS